MNLIFNSDLSDTIGLYDQLTNQTSPIIYKFKEDMQYFKKLTSGTSDKPSVLICGYNTFINLNPSILTKNSRILWVLSRTHNVNIEENIKLFRTYDELINKYTESKSKYNFWVIGGKQIYELFENIVDNVYHCHVQHLPDYSISPIRVEGSHPKEGSSSPFRVEGEGSNPKGGGPSFNGYNQIVYTLPKYFKLTECSELIPMVDHNKDQSAPTMNSYFKTYVNNFSVTDYQYDDHSKSKSKSKSKSEYQYLNLLYKTLTSTIRPTRNANTYSYFGDQIRFNLQEGFPLLTSKKMFFKGIIQELLFFIRGSTNSKELEANGVNIWKGNTSREFLDKNGFNSYEEGEMGPMYGFQWRHFNGEIDQLKNVLTELENDSNSRRLLMTTFNPLQVNRGVLYPCHSLIIQFYVEKYTGVDKETDNLLVSLHMYQRSGDVYLGIPWNIASTSLLLAIVCDSLTKKSGKYKYMPKDVIISFGDVHLYEQHKLQAIEQLKRKPLHMCNLKILNSHDNIDDYKYEDFVLEEYKSYPVIKAEMVP